MTAVAAPSLPLTRARWIHSASTDIVIALAWVPFALAALVLRGNGDAVAALMSATLLFSFTHQPLTLALVYGDADQFALRRRIFTWSPLVFAVLVYATLNVSLVTLAIVGGLWNAVHTLFQRYGLIRIYGRKVGENDGRLERALLLSWLIGVAVVAAADPATPDRIIEAGLGGHNRDVLEVLTDLRPGALVLLPFVAAAAIGLTVAWVRREMRAGATANPAKQVYMLSTAVLFGVMLVAPIAGIIGYVGSHAFEYFVIVYTNLKSRYQDHPDDAALVGRAVRSPIGRPGFLVLYLGAVVTIVTVLGQMDSPTAYVVVFFVLGGLHVFYDGFIWKLRRGKVARSFDLPAASA
jgi:hypothetical protein